MSSYREGDLVNIKGCNYTVKENYLSANSNGSYPKVLAKILGIDNIDKFVEATLGYSRYDDKKFGFANMADCAKLVKALKDFKDVDLTSSNKLKDLEVKKFFEDEDNLTVLSTSLEELSSLLTNFNNIKNTASNVVTKVKGKIKDLNSAIDSSNLTRIKTLRKELGEIKTHITETSTLLARLSEMGQTLNGEEETFDVTDFLGSED